MTSDERLVKRASKGDARAFEAIYRRYHQDLYRFCLAMVGNPHDAQDALQNTMVKVLRALPGEQREIKLKPWLYRIARNESVEALRKRPEDGELEEDQGAVAGPAEAAEARARLRQLLSDLERLPQRQRAALTMRELSGLGFDEIAQSFGSSEGVARQTLYEARQSLRQLEEGREMSCVAVQKELSDADGRVTRRREIRSHLRSCADCRAFKRGIAARREDLAALAPLPLAASAGLLHSLLAGKAGATGAAGAAGGGGIAGSAAAGAGTTLAGSAVVKSVATVAVVAVAGFSAERGGVIELPLVGKDAPGQSSRAGAGAESGPRGPADEAGAATAGGGREAADGAGNGMKEGGAANSGMRGAKKPATQGSRGAARSRSRAGQSPPGGGHGRSAAEQRGRLGAASKGQNAAGARKPEAAPSRPGGKPPKAKAAPGPAAVAKPQQSATQAAKPAAPVEQPPDGNEPPTRPGKAPKASR
ncbi:MAG: sigma-70 family RNA polymerase sigma factor [Solirubrobacterales bacterium]